MMMTASLTVPENRCPIGTVVGGCNRRGDPDAGASLSYQFLYRRPSGFRQSLFTLEKSTVPFIFEYLSTTKPMGWMDWIRVQAKDEFNATVEGTFTVVLSDVYEPSRPNHLIDLNDSVSLGNKVEPGTFTMGNRPAKWGGWKAPLPIGHPDETFTSASTRSPRSSHEAAIRLTEGQIQ